MVAKGSEYADETEIEYGKAIAKAIDKGDSDRARELTEALREYRRWHKVR